MPQISKIRIVNFQYNDGKRLIADELYDFESKDKGPSDVLINLANGGGKSVLVQLMMQPIIPKAKVACRRIESFFTKSSDHCYVAIEWVLDGSKMKLMTGIAMAASDSSRDMDQDRGFQIKYYTFISSYQNYQGNYDIISLPLSKKENGRFIPASFDDVRNLAKKSGGKLDRYASDDSVKWAERLAQYGIVQGEWRMIEELNSNEDGLSKYFSNLKTSDAVIDKLIIPRIEDKESHRTSRDDSSLETMLISYARQFSKQQDIVQERDACSGFYDMLEKTRVEAEELWKSNDALEKCIEMLFAYADALETKINTQKENSQGLSEQKSKLSETIRHIRWEKASAYYYTCREAFERETASLKEAEAERCAAKDKLDAAKKRLLLIECAHYYGQLREIESQIAAISTEIVNRENNSESAERLASLKYSACIAITNEIQKISSELEIRYSEKETLEASLSALEAELTEIQHSLDKAKENKYKAEAIYEKQMKDDDDIAQEIGFAAIRMLDGKYQQSDLEDWKRALLEKEQSLSYKITEASQKLQKLEERMGLLPQDIENAKNQLREIKSEIDRLNKVIEEYEKVKSSVMDVFSRYSLSQEMLYTDHAESFLKEQIAEIKASVSDVDRRIERTEEAISAVNRGTLHIPKIVSDFLDNTGLHYTSVEKYILTQQSKGLLSRDECQQFLEKYPFTAYGIILEEKDIETLYQEAEDKWLPAVLPVFTASDVDHFMHGESYDSLALSAYSKEYFLDSDGYEASLERSLDELGNRKIILEGRISSLSSDLEIVKSFRIYDAGWEQRTFSEKDRQESQSIEKQEFIDSLKQELAELKETINRIREDEKSLSEDLSVLRNQIQTFEKLIVKLEEEDKLYRDYEISMRKLRELTDDQKNKSDKKGSLDIQLHDATERLKELEAANQKLQDGLSTVDHAPEAEIIPGDWTALLAEYSKLLEAQSADLKRLNDERTRLQKEKDEKQKEIQKRNCELEEYDTLIYSEDLEMGASNDLNVAESEYQSADVVYNSIYRSQGKAEASLENAAKGLDDFGGEALPLNEIGKSFDSRISEARSAISGIDSDLKDIDKILSQLQKVQGKAETAIENYPRPARYTGIILDKDYSAQLNRLTGQIRDWNRSISTHKNSVEDNLKSMASTYGSKSTDVSLAILSMQDLLSNAVVRGDRYYTLCEHIDANMHTAQLRISQIDTDLKEFNKTKGDLIHQCVIQGRQMYEGLMQLSANSRVKVQDKRRQMIRFDIPDSVDENIASASIAAEIEKGATEIAAKILDDSYAESEIRKTAGRIVGSKRLLRKYINQDNIVLKAYKIDRTPDNSGYRTWEQTQVNNSGAEKFVVYFAVILALMAYARDEQDELGGKNNQSVLILDNPFGPISSKHVLEPMFEISRNYKVQMICLSDISKSDIVSCFDLVIRAIVKQLSFGSKEQLTHEGNESIEHGFYRSEQINLWQTQ